MVPNGTKQKSQSKAQNICLNSSTWHRMESKFFIICYVSVFVPIILNEDYMGGVYNNIIDGKV